MGSTGTNVYGVNQVVTLPAAVSASAENSAQGVANTDLVVALPAVSGHSYRLGSIFLSFNENPSTNPKLWVRDSDGVQYFTANITRPGLQAINIVPTWVFPNGKGLVVTLDAGGTGVIGRINVNAWIMDPELPFN